MRTKIRINKESIKVWLEIIAICIAAPWAFYTFYFEKEYQPNHLPAFLTVNTQMRKVSQNNNYEVYDVKITVQNKSKVKESVIAAWFNIIGGRLKIVSNLSDSAYSNSILAGKELYYRYPRYFNVKDSINQVIHWGQILDDNTWLNPDQEITDEFITVIPRGRFDVLTLRVDAITGKNEFQVNWKINADGGTDARLINKKDTLFFDEIRYSKDNSLKSLIADYDLTHTINEQQFSLGFLDSIRPSQIRLETK